MAEQLKLSETQVSPPGAHRRFGGKLMGGVRFGVFSAFLLFLR